MVVPSLLMGGNWNLVNASQLRGCALEQGACTLLRIATILAVSLGKMVSPLRVAVPCEELTECRGYCSLFPAVSLEASVVKSGTCGADRPRRENCSPPSSGLPSPALLQRCNESSLPIKEKQWPN